MKVLYGVSSVGLGHARRSLAIAAKLRDLNPNIEIDWACAEPVKSLIEKSKEGEHILDVKLQSIGSAMESVANYGKISDMSKVARLSSKLGKENYLAIRPILSSYDALIQDEFIETLFAFLWDSSPPLPAKKVVITDYTRFETRSWNPINRLVIAYANRSLRRAFNNQSLRIFADELPFEDGWVSRNFHVVGPIVDDLPTKSKVELQRELFGTEGASVVFTVGGTSIGKTLVEFVIEHADEISTNLQGIRLVVLLGPSLSSKFTKTNSRFLTLVGFTNEALKYFKAADCIVAQAGASTLNEVAFLGVPCVCIPIANHWEQRQSANRFSKLHGFEVLEYMDLSVGNLVSSIRTAQSKSYKSIANNDASSKVARLISLNLL